MKAIDLTPSGILGTVGVIVVVAVCARLGVWQLDRRAARLERNRVVAERLEAEPVALRGIPTDTAGLTYRRVHLEGELDVDRAVVLAGRSYRGAPGVHVLVPLRTGAGAFLVNLGWLPAPDGASAELDALGPGGPAAVEGVLMRFPDVHLAVRPEHFTTTWFRMDGEAIRSQYPYPVARLYLRATNRVSRDTPALAREPDTVRALAGGPLPLDPPSLDAGPHLSYAIQWFSFATIFAIGWTVLLVRGAAASPRHERDGGGPGTSPV
jgi:surfeit locus 1 family protein